MLVTFMINFLINSNSLSLLAGKVLALFPLLCGGRFLTRLYLPFCFEEVKISIG